ncbi:sterile alpha motif domain-containing protein 12 isoform X2 [Mixophyes fleayi]|uniref:sterile alpha motif domain-containing protein 12 isoform X2 n=1 Tax=Mixophyes fleayi TaxID=3061075 RepID=UPI003F4D99EE
MAVEAIHCNRNSNNIDQPTSTDNINLNLQGEQADSPSVKDTSKVPEPKGTPKKLQPDPNPPKPNIVKATKPVAFWTQHDVCKWLKKHCLNQHQLYNESFKEHDITAELLVFISAAHSFRWGVYTLEQMSLAIPTAKTAAATGSKPCFAATDRQEAREDGDFSGESATIRPTASSTAESPGGGPKPPATDTRYTEERHE